MIGVTINRITIDKVMSDPITDKMPNGHLENRGHSRNRTENYNNDHTRGRSRDRHDNRPIQSRQSTFISWKRQI